MMVKENPRQTEATLQASSYMQPRDHSAVSPATSYCFNEISLLDHVPQTNRLDHVLYTPSNRHATSKGSVATLAGRKEEMMLGSRSVRLLR
jgi:hypothetical protein